MTTLTISLPDSLKAFIESEVQTKGYGNVSEYVRTLVRQAREREADERLEALLLEGLQSGQSVPVTPEFWSELKSDAAKILAGRKTTRKRGRQAK